MKKTPGATDRPIHRRLLIIGAGLGGLAAAAQLASRGETDLAILDRGDRVGGVWRANCYPNAACDTPVQLYSFTFHQRINWSSNFAPWHEILDYAESMVRDFGLQPHLQFNTEVASVRWDDGAQRWHVHASDGRRWIARFVIWAGGVFSQPLIPDLPRIDGFKGRIIHTAQWDRSISVTGQTVAVVGGGASSIQMVPYAVDHAKQVYAFIRTPSHVLPKPEVLYGPDDWNRFAQSPDEQVALRQAWFETFEVLATSRFPMNDELISRQEALWKAFLHQEIADPALRARLTPNYRFGCRRPLVSNVYYRSLTAPNIRVMDTGIADLTETGVLTEGGETIDIDTLILATGFKTAGMLGRLDIRGRDGVGMSEQWNALPQAYLGMLVKGFPNLFMIGGPNAIAASLSAIVEAQTDYIEACMALVDQRGGGSVEVTAQAQDAFNDDLVRRGNASVMVLGGCESYYRSGGNGSVFTHWPGTCRAYQQAVASVRTDDLAFEARRVTEPEEASGA